VELRIENLLQLPPRSTTPPSSWSYPKLSTSVVMEEQDEDGKDSSAPSDETPEELEETVAEYFSCIGVDYQLIPKFNGCYSKRSSKGWRFAKLSAHPIIGPRV
jgi:hypothetical protein